MSDSSVPPCAARGTYNIRVGPGGLRTRSVVSCQILFVYSDLDWDRDVQSTTSPRRSLPNPLGPSDLAIGDFGVLAPPVLFLTVPVVSDTSLGPLNSRGTCSYPPGSPVRKQEGRRGVSFYGVELPSTRAPPEIKRGKRREGCPAPECRDCALVPRRGTASPRPPLCLPSAT